ncbi:MAG: glucose-6-phosphate isomerase [Candidatus Gastranaerophilales bacterium]|nr:glucose-6-phosphate isomerase [Candidatus Gastranaerophilales bacterium]
MIKFNYHNVGKDVIGQENGLDINQEFENHKDHIAQIINELYENKDQRGYWSKWMNSGYDEDTLWYINEFAAEVKDKYENMLVLGIGGSSLGGKTIAHATLKPYWNLLSTEQRKGYPRVFFVDNIDSDSINGLLDIIDLKKTLVNIITKSGDTTEIMAVYMIIKDRMKKECDDNYRESIVVTTDRNVGVLRQLASQEGYKAFEVPDDVGGRYSVFSSVGLLPFAVLGIDIKELLRGVRDMDALCQNRDIYQNIAAQNALIHYLMSIQKGKNITVFMPYSDRLKYLPDWFSQLWAESLGKERDWDGNKVNVGLTPLKAVGVTDQHSLLQLYNEGPNDKVIDFIKVEEFDTQLNIPNIFQYTGLGYLSGKSVNDLIHAEELSTTVSVTDYQKPNVTISIPKINEYYLGQLMYMLMMQTAITGALFNIDPFNQPGVEQSQNYVYALMGRVGYEESARILQEKVEV